MVYLNYWTNAEITVTIIAASIPVLRVLFHDVKKTMTGASKTYYGPGGTLDSANKKSRLPTNRTTTVVTAGPTRSHSSEIDSDDLYKDGSAGRIVQTSDFGVEYSEQKD